jgi:N-acetylglucosamine-6-phosphate deacetylase
MTSCPPTTIINARLPGYSEQSYIQLDDHHHIADIRLMNGLPPVLTEGQTVIDVAGDWISPGGVDLQINGALGLAFPDLNLENSNVLPKISQFLWDQGIDAFLPTLVTTSVETIQRSLATLAPYVNQASSNTAQILGVHLEGPFLNSAKRGAHPQEHLLPLTIDQVKRVLGDYASIIKVMTLAPELDPTGEAIAYLRSLGITVSLGHSQATAAQAQHAFAQGITMLTHAFNALPGLHHREPGALGAAIANAQIHCGLIADGQHVSPLMLELFLRMRRNPTQSAYAHGIFLVSDALAPLGLPDGTYPWDQRQITVTQGTARLPDGTLAGTTLPLLVSVRHLIDWTISPVEEAIALATIAPRRAIGLPALEVNQPAHLLRWSLNSTTNQWQWQRLVTD